MAVPRKRRDNRGVTPTFNIVLPPPVAVTVLDSRNSVNSMNSSAGTYNKNTATSNQNSGRSPTSRRIENDYVNRNDYDRNRRDKAMTSPNCLAQSRRSNNEFECGKQHNQGDENETNSTKHRDAPTHSQKRHIEGLNDSSSADICPDVSTSPTLRGAMLARYSQLKLVASRLAMLAMNSVGSREESFAQWSSFYSKQRERMESLSRASRSGRPELRASTSSLDEDCSSCSQPQSSQRGCATRSPVGALLVDISTPPTSPVVKTVPLFPNDDPSMTDESRMSSDACKIDLSEQSSQPSSPAATKYTSSQGVDSPTRQLSSSQNGQHFGNHCLSNTSGHHHHHHHQTSSPATGLLAIPAVASGHSADSFTTHLQLANPQLGEAEVQAPPLIPLEDLKLGPLLGVGAYGSVRAAYYSRRMYALKSINLSEALDPSVTEVERRARKYAIVREIQMVRRKQYHHFNLVNLFCDYFTRGALITTDGKSTSADAGRMSTTITTSADPDTNIIQASASSTCQTYEDISIAPSNHSDGNFRSPRDEQSCSSDDNSSSSAYGDAYLHILMERALFSLEDLLSMSTKLLENSMQEMTLKFLGEEFAANLWSSEGKGINDSSEVQAMPEILVAMIAHDTLHGLAFMHDTMGVVHTDIKPANLMFSEDLKSIKIADFGCSCPIGGRDRSSGAGTKLYFPPERMTGVFTDGEQYMPTPATDIWSLGITLLELAAGSHPCYEFREEYWEYTEKLNLDNMVMPETISPTFNDFLRLFLDVDPKKRPSAQEALEHPFITRYKEVRVRNNISQFLAQLTSIAMGDKLELRIYKVDDLLWPRRYLEWLEDSARQSYAIAATAYADPDSDHYLIAVLAPSRGAHDMLERLWSVDVDEEMAKELRRELVHSAFIADNDRVMVRRRGQSLKVELRRLQSRAEVESALCRRFGPTEPPIDSQRLWGKPPVTSKIPQDLSFSALVKVLCSGREKLASWPTAWSKMSNIANLLQSEEV